MTKKLKTLKDLYKLDNHSQIDYYTLESIQSEASRWIRELNNRNPNLPYIHDEEDLYAKDFLVDWIKHFFDLEEKK
jgi:hypothetical protein